MALFMLALFLPSGYGGGTTVTYGYDAVGNIKIIGTTAGAPTPQSAVSRRTHGTVGTFDLLLSSSPANPTTEPRIGPAQTIVFTFDKPITGAAVTVIEGSATAGAPTFNGNTVIVNLNAVADLQYVTVVLSNVTASDATNGGSAAVRIGFLAADVNQNRVVTLSDLGLVNAQISQPVTTANYLKDLNASGAITFGDYGIANANVTHILPAP